MWGVSAASRRIFAYNRPTDMRKSFFGLLALVQQVSTGDPYSGSLFVFVNGKRPIFGVLARAADGEHAVAGRGLLGGA